MKASEPHYPVGFQSHIPQGLLREFVDVIYFLSGKEMGPSRKVWWKNPLIPDKRQFAWFTDPEGNMIGLLTAP
jgi:hypothetical protein